MLGEHPEDMPNTLGPEQAGGSAPRESCANLDLVPPRGLCAKDTSGLKPEEVALPRCSMLGRCEEGVG